MVNFKYVKCDVVGNVNVKINMRSKLKKIIKKNNKNWIKCFDIKKWFLYDM